MKKYTWLFFRAPNMHPLRFRSMKRVSCSFMHSPHQPWQWVFQIGPHWRKPQVKVRRWVQWVISLQIPNTWIQFETWLNYNYSLSWKELSCYSPTGPQMGILPTFTPKKPPKMTTFRCCFDVPTFISMTLSQLSNQEPGSLETKIVAKFFSGPSRQFWMTSLVTFLQIETDHPGACWLVLCVYIYMYIYNLFIHLFILIIIINYVCVIYIYKLPDLYKMDQNRPNRSK